MTLVYQRQVEGPACHAFVVGCGYFPSLPNAPNDDRKACPDSARAVVDFLVRNADRLTAGLASIEVLLSEPGGAANDVARTGPQDPRAATAVDAAKAANLQAAFDRWTTRCRAGDHLFFYGSSHGLADRDESAFMVLEDVYDNPANRWRNVVDVGALARFLPATTGAGASWIFLDACQQVLPSIVQQIGGLHGLPLVAANVKQLTNTKVRSVSLAATGYGDFAEAPAQGGVAYFTRALLEALGNCCVEPTSSGWRVSSKELLNGAVGKVGWVAFGDLLDPESLNAVPGSNYYFLQVDQPEIPIMVATEPPSLIATAQGVRVLRGNGVTLLRPGGAAEPVWRFRLAPDMQSHTAEAVIDGPRTLQQTFAPLPPCQVVELQS